MSELTKRLEGSVCYASTNKEWPNVLLQEAADRIDKLEECLREVVRRLDEIANWRNGAAAYDADVGNEPREFCEDVELIEGSAKDAADKARALLEEK